MKTELQSKCSSRKPESSGPRAAIAPPNPDQRAIARVRPSGVQMAVISASVVENAMPAAKPPNIRAPIKTPSEGATAARTNRAPPERL